jgi:tetratricopeptide (TPR) repeat protein
MNTLMEREAMEDERLDFIAGYITRSVNKSGSLDGRILKGAVLTDLRRILDEDYDRAISVLSQLSQHEQLPVKHLLLAERHLCANQPEMALAALDELQRADPNLPESNLMRGLIFRQKQSNAKARDCLAAAVKARPFMPLAWESLIDMAIEEENVHEAARLVNEALRFDPGNKDLIEFQGCLSTKEHDPAGGGQHGHP